MILPLILIIVVLLVLLPTIGAAVGSLVTTLVAGLIVGALGRLVVPGRQPIGCLFTTLVGVAGSLLGTLVAHSLHVGRFGTLVLDVAVAAVLVAVLARRR